MVTARRVDGGVAHSDAAIRRERGADPRRRLDIRRPVRDMLSGYRVFSRRFVKSFPALATVSRSKRS